MRTSEDCAPIVFASQLIRKRKELNFLLRALLDHGFVGSNFAVADVDDAVRVLRDVVFVGYEDNGVPLLVEVFSRAFFAFSIRSSAGVPL